MLCRRLPRTSGRPSNPRASGPAGSLFGRRASAAEMRPAPGQALRRPAAFAIVVFLEGQGAFRQVQPGLLGGSEDVDVGRSEEHTSELQSLMRISYAVFCLKKKKITS